MSRSGLEPKTPCLKGKCFSKSVLFKSSKETGPFSGFKGYLALPGSQGNFLAAEGVST